MSAIKLLGLNIISMKVISYNVRSWTRGNDWKERFADIKRLLEVVSPDIILLQEADPPFGGKIIPDGYKRATHGVSHFILVRDGIKVKRSAFGIFYDWCDIDDMRVINVHSRWEDKIISDTMKKVCNLMTYKTIVGGDFNVGVSKIQSLNVGYNLKVIGEDTFQNWSKPESHGEIDHFLLHGLDGDVYIASHEKLSDHYPIYLK